MDLFYRMEWPCHSVIFNNRRIASEITFDEYYICNELGGLKSFRDEDWYDIVIFVDVEVNDDEINALIKRLPKFKKRY